MQRTLHITIRPDWQGALRQTLTRAQAGIERDDAYVGETLNFETPAAFFSRLTANRWAVLAALQGDSGANRDAASPEIGIGVRELARRLGRDVKRVHEDAAALVELGLIERGESGKLSCPYADIHIDMHVLRKAAQIQSASTRRVACKKKGPLSFIKTKG